MPSPPRARALLAALALTASLTAGCATPWSDNAPPEVSWVKGPVGQRPTVTIPHEPAPKKARATVLHEGEGPELRKGQIAVAEVDMWIWEQRKRFMSTYDQQQPTSVTFDGEHVAKTWDQALIGKRAGSRVLMVAPATHGFGPHGMSPANVTPTDHLAVVFDLIGAYEPHQQIPERPGAPVAGFPEVNVPKGQEPTVRWGDSQAPEKLRSGALVAGDGARIEDGDKVVVQATSWVWKDKQPFNSTYLRKTPNGFLMKEKALLPGWYEALAGQKVGSRVVIAVPPNQRPGFKFTKGGMATPPGKPVLHVIDILDRIPG
ncbi:FKBP-type peptidyl-prolyl cis-trans isomerase [Streptomyces monticola]|uniref:Peptidyl-prolyl cis-trans isomerase n=1 Tax=Streptomyces monticola TaxID=2666263 RepID=A0ABW2JNQ5_9ACTN